jgi:hypothetical protein
MIKGTTKTLKKTKIDSKCDKETQAKFEIEWHYTTNLSGKHEFVYTGKEIGKDYYDPGEQKLINVGDTVIYKKKDHLNDGVTATVKEITKSLTKKELAEQGKKETTKFNDSYTLKFQNPPFQSKWPNQYKKIKNVQKVNMEKVPTHKDFICVNMNKKNSTRKNIKGTPTVSPVKKDVLKFQVELQMKKTFLTSKYYKNREEETQPEFKIEGVLAKNTHGKKVIDKNALVEPTQSYKIDYVSFRDIFTSRKSKSKSKKYGGEYYKLKVKVHLGLRDISSSGLGTDNLVLAMRCDERWNRINQIFREFKDESIEKVKNLFPERSKKETDKLVKSHHTRNVVKDKLKKLRFKDKAKGTKPRNVLGEKEMDELVASSAREGKKQDWMDAKDRMTEQEMKIALFGEGQGYGEEEDLEEVIEQKGGHNELDVGTFVYLETVYSQNQPPFRFYYKIIQRSGNTEPIMLKLQRVNQNGNTTYIEQPMWLNQKSVLNSYKIFEPSPIQEGGRRLKYTRKKRLYKRRKTRKK